MVDKPRKPTGRRVKFGDVVRLVTDRCNPAAEGVERYVGLEHIEPNDLRIRKCGMVADGTTFTNRFRSGQVLFGKRRAYQRKVAVADFDGVCSGDVYVFESVDPQLLLPELLPFLCQTESFSQYAVGTSAGSLSPRTNWSSLAKYEFTLPSIEEQRRFLSALDRAQQLLDALYDNSEALRGLYRSASMRMFCRDGTMTFSSPEQWAKAGWELSSLEEVVSPDAAVSYGIVQPGDSVSGGVPTLTSNNLNIGFDSDLHYTAPQIEEKYSRTRITSGDILVTVKGFGTGKIGVVPPHFRGNITRDLARIRLGDRIDRRYFVHLWRNPAFKHYWRASSVGSTRPELSIGVLRSLMIPHPARAEQGSIADALDGIEIASREVTSRRAKVCEMALRLANGCFSDAF